jgi:hypothetical protein
MGLLTGGQASLQLPSSSATRLSHGLLQEALCSEHERIELELRSLLESHLLALAVPPGVPSILLGPIFGLEPVAKLVLSLATGEQPLTVTSMPLLERTTRSVASALLWLQRDADRTIKTLPGGGIRLNTHSGDVVEILSREQFPEAGESCYVRRQFHFEGEIDPASPLLVQLQSGTDCSPEGNATLCLLPLQPPSSGSESTAFSLSLRLTRSASGRRLSGVAEATLVSDPTSSPASSFLIEDLGSPSISARSLS